MTVEQLIKELSKHPKNVRVEFATYEAKPGKWDGNDFHPIKEVTWAPSCGISSEVVTLHPGEGVSY